MIGLYFYSQALIKVEAPQLELGEKIVVTLSDGKTIYTYENLLVEEEGKLLYKGANSTIDLTGGVVDMKSGINIFRLTSIVSLILIMAVFVKFVVKIQRPILT